MTRLTDLTEQSHKAIRRAAIAMGAGAAMFAGFAAPALAQDAPAPTPIEIPQVWKDNLPTMVVGTWAFQHPEGCFSAYWGCYESEESYNAGIEPKNPFPLNAEARAFHDEVVRNLGEGRSTYDPNALCYPQGMPDRARATFKLVPGPIGDRWYLILGGQEFRTIWMDGRDMPERQLYDYTFWGDSVGHFEGDTLVIETRNMVGENSAISPNTPKSDDFWVIEKWTPVSADELTAEISFKDEQRFTDVFTETYQVKRNPRGDTGQPQDPCISGIGQRYVPDPVTGEQVLSGPGGKPLEKAVF